MAKTSTSTDSSMLTVTTGSGAADGTHTIKIEQLAAAKSMAALVAETVEVYQYAAEEKGVGLSYTAQGPLLVTADADRIRQVLANLLDNAVKYTPSGGRVEVVAGRTDGAIAVSVIDSGEGISPDDIPRIFDRLYRADKSRSRRGLGLGLSLVRAVLYAHGGAIDVQSTPGAGSRFQFTLPVAVGAQTDKAT